MSATEKPAPKASSPRRPNPDPPRPERRPDGVAAKTRRIAAWVLVAATLGFAGVAILGIWGVFSGDGSDVVWKAFTSLVIVMFAAGVTILVADRVDRG
jgi:hypothetical protein